MCCGKHKGYTRAMNTNALPIHSILVVDDSPVQRAFAVDLCRQLGVATVHEASDGAQALTLIGGLDELPGLALIDLEMPGMDGVELVQGMYAADFMVPLIIVSAREQSIIDSTARMIGALGLPLIGALRKPLKREELEPLLRSELLT